MKFRKQPKNKRPILGKKELIEFDFSHATQADLHWIEGKMLRGVDFRAYAAAMARYCVRCPEQWGPPHDPETFMKLLPGAVFGQCVHTFGKSLIEHGRMILGSEQTGQH